MPTVMPQLWGLVSGKADEVLCYFHQRSKQAKVSFRDFVRTKSEMLSLVIPGRPMMNLIDHEDDWCALTADLLEVIQSSQIGFRIFGFAVQNVLNGEIVLRVQAGIGKLFEATHISVADFDRCRKACLQECERIPGITRLLEKRVVELCYRGGYLQGDLPELERAGGLDVRRRRQAVGHRRRRPLAFAVRA